MARDSYNLPGDNIRYIYKDNNINPIINLIKLLCQDKDLYDKYRSFIKVEDKELQFIFSCLDESQLPLTLDELELICVSKPVKPEFRDTVRAILAQVKQSEVSSDTIQQVLFEYRQRSKLFKLAEVAYNASEGKQSIEDVSIALGELDSLKVEDIDDSPRFVTNSLEELYDETVSKQGLRWRLRSLNESLGSLRKGDFGFLFARPESGKTTFLCSEISYFAEQLERDAGPGLWFNNEEQGTKVQLRLFQSVFGVQTYQLWGDRRGYQQKYDDLIGNRLRVWDSAVITRREVDQLVEQLRPSFIVFDQIDKIGGFESDREDLRLGQIYIWARELAKTYCPVIGVCQADGTGEGVKRLTMSHVANAKTAKQAEADWILGIGKSSDLDLEYVRHFNISKNKLQGDRDTRPELRHAFWDVIIEPEIARYKDVG